MLTAPDPRGFPSRARLELDTQRIVRFVERRTGLLSRWRGEVRIAHPDAPWLGLKHPECWIEYHPQLLGDAEFYYVALEEALHACSVLLPVADRPLAQLRSPWWRTFPTRAGSAWMARICGRWDRFVGMPRRSTSGYWVLRMRFAGIVLTVQKGV